MANSQIAGIGSGINWQETLDQLMQIERRPIQLKQQRRQTLDSRNSAWDAISGKLTGLQNTLRSMDTMKEMMIKGTSSTDTDVITATASENATTGNYAIRVNQLANAHKVISTGFPNMSGAIFSNSGTFTIKGFSGEELSFDVTPDTTLSDLKRRINANSKCDVTASIMNDGDPTNPYRLILSSKQTGEKSEIIIGGTALAGTDFKDIAVSDAKSNIANVGNGKIDTACQMFTGVEDTFTFSVTSAGLRTVGTDNITIEARNSAGNLVKTVTLPPGYAGEELDIENGFKVSLTVGQTINNGDKFEVKTTDQTARDSIIEVENIAIQKSSNTITDVIDGVSLTLKDLTTTQPINVSITNDIEGVKKLVNQFIGDYNTVVNTVKGYQKWDDQLKQGGALFGDSQAKSITQDLGILMSSMNEGMDQSQIFQTLSQVGINLDADGKLKMDNTKFTKSLNENFEETIRLFTIDSSITGTNKDKFLISSNTEYTKGGDYAVNVVVSGGKITSATIGGEAVDISGKFITGKKGTSAEGLMLSVETGVDGTFNATVKFSAGKNQELITQIQQYVQTDQVNGNDGLVPLAKDTTKKSIENINKQIATMEEKLERTRKIMEKKWLAMETYVTKMKSQQAQNSAMSF